MYIVNISISFHINDHHWSVGRPEDYSIATSICLIIVINEKKKRAKAIQKRQNAQKIFKKKILLNIT
jgi:hypothetical protein